MVKHLPLLLIMTKLIFPLAFALAFASPLLSSGARANADESEGLFVAGKRAAEPLSIKDGYFIYRTKAVRLDINRAVLRPDTDDKKMCWLEIYFSKNGEIYNADPGDLYLFRIGGKDHQGFSTRGDRWALGWKAEDLKAARDLLANIGKVYALPAEQVIDQTR